ncbi:MAG: twin-arginine translocation signal domain-containing protein [Bacteroidota bacterium]|nr:twin-arginine translocation signal domain-containing protein [Bacteroidota bacterium]
MMKTNRRSFIKRSSLAMAGAGLIGSSLKGKLSSAT